MLRKKSTKIEVYRAEGETCPDCGRSSSANLEIVIHYEMQDPEEEERTVEIIEDKTGIYDQCFLPLIFDDSSLEGFGKRLFKELEEELNFRTRSDLKKIEIIERSPDATIIRRKDIE